MAMRILVVEDDDEIAEFIVRGLREEGFVVDHVILDLWLPGEDGIAVLKKMRQANNATPVLILTARDSVENRVEGLNTGARANGETAQDEPWLLKDLRKTCATYYDVHVPESSIEILGHSVGGVTYRHYAHRASLAFKAITTLPQPTAFMGLLKGYDDECPCCRRPFVDA